MTVHATETFHIYLELPVVTKRRKKRIRRILADLGCHSFQLFDKGALIAGGFISESEAYAAEDKILKGLEEGGEL